MQLYKRLILFLSFLFFCSNVFAADPLASRIRTDYSSFDNNLSSSETNVQLSLDAVDDMTVFNGVGIALKTPDSLGVGNGAFGNATNLNQSVAIGNDAGLNADDHDFNLLIGANVMKDAYGANHIGDTIVGVNAGYSIGAFGDASSYVSLIGYASGGYILGANRMTLLGANAAGNISYVDDLTAMGYGVCQNCSAADRSTIIGTFAAFGAGSITDSVVIGYNAAYNESILDNVLWIEQGDSATPLIYGNFQKDIVKINSFLGVNSDVDIENYNFVVRGNSYLGGNLTIEYDISAANLSGTNTGDQVTANEASDTISFPVFVGTAVGDTALKTNASLKFNASTAQLGSASFVSSVATGTQPYATTSTTLNTNLNADKVDGIDGFGYSLQTFSSNTNPTDGLTYYTGSSPVSAPSNTADWQRVYIPKAGTIKAAYVIFTTLGTLGSTETSTVSIRLNNTSDTTISAVATQDASLRVFSNTNLSIAVSAGDYIEIKWVAPTWATNPTNVRITSTIYIE